MKAFEAVILSYILSTASECAAFSVTQPISGARYSLVSTELNMATQITMPALSSTMKEGRVVTWLKNEGDTIEAGEAIMVVESDKADMDVEAFEDGVLAKILVGEGEMAPVGNAVAIIADSAADVDSAIASFSANGASVTVAEPATTATVTAPSAAGMSKTTINIEIFNNFI
jgi:pyruvate dehydrogenase E2 component (dihydrolipoamide acetyltransferase)